MIRPLAPFTATLTDMAQLVGASLHGADLSFTGITHVDSEVEAGDLFIAVAGAHVHGATFIDSAVKRGAVAVLTDEAGLAYCAGVPALVVSDVRTAGALIAASLYQNPMRDLMSIGITGTNGKTTVSTLLYQIFAAVGRDSGLIGTVETRIGAEVLKSSRTTPEAAELQALAAVMRERHMRHLVMEVSSHALSLKRMKGSHFAIAAFTNLTQDHLDFHKDMDSYFAAKAQLFTSEYADQVFINIDSPYGQRLADQVKIGVTTLSRSNTLATWHFTQTHNVARGVEFSARGTGGILIESRTQLSGGFNLDNLLLALAIAVECGIDPIELAAITPSLTGAAGRLEAVSLGQGYRAFVDYAHSPDAVSNVLAAAREFTPGKIIAVLGCGGDRDASKRPLMGRALVDGADVAIFTSDNPRSEKPSEILKQMTSSLNFQAPSQIVEDRTDAIRVAVALATGADTVLVLGKGHETGQEIAGVVTAFDDRLVLAQAIEEKP
ncbi:UDP-N-acetylmuramoyl-L-alanyl-D-glutamate--2,6-diaminopimelate ligase [Candidatus Planktophila dulcis]|uniref:UDP-N-acetylmuramoyl-L-alanyl-D-glutamate--2, 6-diaminopimelate ligase n=1 Tax=Candidatus Planktophila dulcis TaxID=1884914 RepID=UPI003CF69981